MWGQDKQNSKHTTDAEQVDGQAAAGQFGAVGAGDVVAKEGVKLRAPAVITGSVKTPVLSMESGVLFNGGLEMSQSLREVPQRATVHTLGAVVAEAIGATGDSLKKELEWTSGSKKA